MAEKEGKINGKVFWQLIDQSYKSSGGNKDKQVQALKKALSAYSRTDLLTFITIYTDHIYRANQWHLWTASELINGHIDEDSFEQFRNWLISKGQKTYQDALKDPETLIGNVKPGQATFPAFHNLGRQVYIEKFQSKPPYQVRHKPKRRGVPYEGDPEDKYPKLKAWLDQQAPQK